MERLFRHRIANVRARWAFWRWQDIYGTGDEIYLTRLIILRTPFFSLLLHWIRKPDPDEALHDHPWSFFAFVLSGEYMEVVGKPSKDKTRMENVRFKLVKLFNWKGTRSAHRIAKLAEGGAITLVLTGPKRKSWGFYEKDWGRTDLVFDGNVPVKYVPWKEFLGFGR